MILNYTHKHFILIFIEEQEGSDVVYSVSESFVGYICLRHSWSHCLGIVFLMVVVVVQDKLEIHSVLLMVVARLTEETDNGLANLVSFKAEDTLSLAPSLKSK